MSNVDRRTALKALAGLGMGALLHPSRLWADMPLDQGDVKIAEWVKAGRNKSIEDKYRSDSKGYEHHIGSIAFYDREIEIDGQKWVVQYADSGPISKETGLFSPDGTTNKYDVLMYRLSPKPGEQIRMLKDDVEFTNIGLEGILDNGKLEEYGYFYNPNSVGFRGQLHQRFDQYNNDPLDTVTARVQREIKKRTHIYINLELFKEGERRYNELRQQILAVISHQ